jgi:hypothetical protein
MHINVTIWLLLLYLVGQAEAIRLAVARALLMHEPELKPTLRHAGLISHDARVVERKKPGQAKARKKYTWYVIFRCIYYYRFTNVYIMVYRVKR